MQLFGWTLHSCWMLLTVISVCCCVDIGSSTEINEEVMEEQPWIWNDFKLAGAARKFHSILDDEDNDNIVAISDRAAVPRAWKKKGKPNIFATASSFRENQQQEPEEKQQQQQQQQRGSPSGSVDSPNDDYVYEDRPLMNPLMADESGQYYGKLTTDIVKRSQLPSFNPLNDGKRRQKQQQQQRNSMTPQQTLSSSSSSSTGVDDSIASQEQQSSLSAIGRDSAEPRVLPLLGFHSAVNKINRQKESFLKKILRQAVNEEEPKLHAEMYCTGLTTSGPVSFAVLAADRRAGKPKDGGKTTTTKKDFAKISKKYR
uniref:Uncharacterized protein n=1 Tax=Daphnia galeata TaxID=27404 RepID=A0A8J2S6U5_9CRUS|nr:unnamed protein product [Daphnia galeata]